VDSRCDGARFGARSGAAGHGGGAGRVGKQGRDQILAIVKQMRLNEAMEALRQQR